jgi:hypothetical protein
VTTNLPPEFKAPLPAAISINQYDFRIYQLPPTADAECDPVTIIIIDGININCFNYEATNQTFIIAPAGLCSPNTYNVDI